MGVAGTGRGMQLCGVGGGDGGRRWRGGEVAAFRLRTHGVDYSGRTAGTARRLRLLPSPGPLQRAPLGDPQSSLVCHKQTLAVPWGTVPGPSAPSTP